MPGHNKTAVTRARIGERLASACPGTGWHGAVPAGRALLKSPNVTGQNGTGQYASARIKPCISALLISGAGVTSFLIVTVPAVVSRPVAPCAHAAASADIDGSADSQTISGTRQPTRTVRCRSVGSTPGDIPAHDASPPRASAGRVPRCRAPHWPYHRVPGGAAPSRRSMRSFPPVGLGEARHRNRIGPGEVPQSHYDEVVTSHPPARSGGEGVPEGALVLGVELRVVDQGGAAACAK
jgi:hypothetical protein